MSNPSRILLATLLAATSLVQAYAQKGKSNPEQAPTYSDADKKKLAEIEQRPEIKQAIQEKWDAKRLTDITFIQNVNASAHIARAIAFENEP